MGQLFAALATELGKHKNTLIDDQIKFPVTVDKFNTFVLKPEETTDRKEVGAWVSVRPVSDNPDKKTYLGIYLGELPVGTMNTYNPDRKELAIILKRNPAMWVPDLKKIVWGMGSWWTTIDSPEKLRSITDLDINNVWYVKALKELEDGSRRDTSENDNGL